MRVCIRVPGEPYALKRHRTRVVRAKGKTFATQYDPPENRNWKAYAASLFVEAMAGREPFSGPVSLTVVAQFTCPKSRHRQRTPRPEEPHTKRPDISNVVKLVEDAATGILWLDDSQVCHITVGKITGAQGVAPYVHVGVVEVKGLWIVNKSAAVPIVKDG